jgi:hypothetical protein
MFSSTAEIIYKNSWWAVAEVDREIVRYYSNWVYRRFGLKLYGSRWSPHITIIRGEEPPNKDLWGKYDLDNWEFEYDISPHRDRDSVFWWIDVKCERMLDLREELGLPRFPEYNFHITVGREHPKEHKTKLAHIA